MYGFFCFYAKIDSWISSATQNLHQYLKMFGFPIFKISYDILTVLNPVHPKSFVAFGFRNEINCLFKF
jgi:hypothetical protein